MSNETLDQIEDESLETGVPDSVDNPDAETEQVEETEGEQDSPEELATDVQDDLVIQLDEKEEEDEPGKGKSLPNELRRLLREKEKERRKLAEELEKIKGGESVEKPLTKPKLEDFDYDAEQFEAALEKFYAAKAEQDKKQAQQRAQQEEAAKEWEAVQKRYVEGKTKLPADKMQEAEDEVVSVLPPGRQGLLMEVADDAALLVLALGTNPQTLRKLASIKSDAIFVKELDRIEMNIKTAPKKTAPPPERTISGSGRTPGATASNLDKLKAEAVKSGDYSKYFAEKRRLGK